MFGGYEADLMLKPDEDTMLRTRGSFLDFLNREDLEPIKLLAKTSHEMPGSKLLIMEILNVFENVSRLRIC